MIDKCSHHTPYFGEHLIVFVDLCFKTNIPTVTLCRNWRNYSPEKLNCFLANQSLDFENDSVQEYWNCLENILINATDHLAPLLPVKNLPFNSLNVPVLLKSLVNKRYRLLKKNKIINCRECSVTIKNLKKKLNITTF
jgi:hypothetical protein